MNDETSKKTVFVGLSGGVDSSVTALRLKKQGYFVVGVFIKVWHPDFLPCGWEAERLDAMAVAAKLDIPFMTCDGEDAYKRAVADYFIAEYKAGRTPNPDVMCNKFVKFGVFLDFATERGADFVATGHYAQVEHQGDTHILKRGIDSSKDQSYFLWTLTQEQLVLTLFPIGNTTKNEVREEARQAGLLTAEKRDSQGICFLGHVDIPDFLSHYITLSEGSVVGENGAIIGTHKGALVYTLGQRQGLRINSKESERSVQYVVGRDLEKNIVYVSTKKPEAKVNDMLTLSEVNYIGWDPTVGEVVEVETRYRQKSVSCSVRSVEEGQLELVYLEPSEAVSVGQSCVLYLGDTCLGGGIITR